MATDKTLLNKGIKHLSWALPFLFIGPSIIHNAFLNKGNLWHYLILAIGIVFCVFGIYKLFIGIKTMVNSMTDE